MTAKNILMIENTYNGVGGHDTVIVNLCLELQKLGYLENNKDSVSNNCHVRWKLVTLERDIPMFGSL